MPLLSWKCEVGYYEQALLPTGASVEPASMAPWPARRILSAAQGQALRAALGGRLLAVCFGAGVDSTAMLVALREAGLRPSLITMADTGGEKPETMAHLERMNAVLAEWGWPLVDLCQKRTLPRTGYTDLFGNCWANETLPSLAFGMKSCSIKWKQDPQGQFIKGAVRGPNARPPHPVWLAAKARGERIVKLIGYECGTADKRRAAAAPIADADFDYAYPLQLIGWTRRDCVSAIEAALGAELVPIKSACFFCPASKDWELYWLAGTHPELFEQALLLERRAMTGKHSRFDEVVLGASWGELVRDAGQFPSSPTCVGLGRSFARNQWARVHGVVDDDFRVIRSAAGRFLSMADALRDADNALDRRSQSAAAKAQAITIHRRDPAKVAPALA